jgi:hypothetical protein
VKNQTLKETTVKVKMKVKEKKTPNKATVVKEKIVVRVKVNPMMTNLTKALNLKTKTKRLKKFL